MATAGPSVAALSRYFEDASRDVVAIRDRDGNMQQFLALSRPDDVMGPLLESLKSMVAAAEKNALQFQTLGSASAQIAFDSVRQSQRELAQSTLDYQLGSTLIASDIAQRFEVETGQIASEAMQRLAFDGAQLLSDVQDLEIIQTDLSAWLGATYDVSAATGLGDLHVGQVIPADFLGTLPSWESWNVDRKRLRVRGWINELGSTADPSTVELIEVDGREMGSKWDDYWISYLGVRINGKPKSNDTPTVDFDGRTLAVWGIRINRYDTEPYLEVRNPPWGDGKPSLRNLDMHRQADNQRMLSALQLLGIRRRRGRKGLTEVWEADAFHDAYRAAEAKVRARRPGRRPRQLDIAGEMAMCERHLRRLLSLFGKPPQKQS